MAIAKNIFVSSMSPVEILRAFNVKLFYPENYAVKLAYKKRFGSISQKGLVNENACSYSILDLDFNVFSGHNKDFIKPDLIVYNTAQCLDIKYWFNYYSEKYNVPMIGIETPHMIEMNDLSTREYIVKQLYNLISRLEIYLNEDFNYDRFHNIYLKSVESAILWERIQSYAKYVPAYIDFFELCKHMSGIVLDRGEDKLIYEYQNIINTLEERKNKKVYSNSEEKYRILWCGMPLWGNFYKLKSIFDQLNTVIVVSTYTQSWNFGFDVNNPLESIAKEYAYRFINLTEKDKLDYLVKLAVEFNVDAVVFHHSVSCKRNCDNYYGLSEKLKNKYNILSITFEADHADCRKFDSKRFSVQLEAMLDIVDKNKRNSNIGVYN